MPSQPEFITALQQPQAYPHGVTLPIEVCETHISWVLLTGEFAYKIKKPVNFGFLDFSSLEKRLFFCHEELRLNARLAPELYLEVVPIAGSPRKPALDGQGTPFEYAVKMRQFDPRQSFDVLLKTSALNPELLIEIAKTIAEFHQQIAIADEHLPYGEPTAIHQPAMENFSHIQDILASVPTSIDWRERLHTLKTWTEKEFMRLKAVFQSRKQQGFIRECHGDLHLRNITLWKHRVTAFDGIEFNANLRWIDTMSELAFLVMDLDDHQRRDLARITLNTYLEVTGDYAGLSVFHYYLVYRAMVRAKVACLRLQQKPDDTEAMLEIKNYLQLAQHYMAPAKPKIIILHGLSGSGKTYLAQQLLTQLDLIHIRSDIERKRLFHLDASARTSAAIGEGIYQAESTQRTYERLLILSQSIVSAGYSVLVDATFLKQWQRQLFTELAKSMKFSFVILHCQADNAVQEQRILRRSQIGKDPSEADINVLQQQLTQQEPLTSDELNNTIHINTTGSLHLDDIVNRLQHQAANNTRPSEMLM